MNYYEHHLGDYLRATAHLSMLEDGAYRRLLDVYYVKEQPIPAELKDACRLVRAAAKQDRDAVAVVLREFFEPWPEGWKHKRCDAEIARFQDKQAKAKRSAELRWGAQRSQSDGNANAPPNAHADDMRTHSEGNALQSPVTSNQTEDKETPPTGGAKKNPTAAGKPATPRARRCPADFEVSASLRRWASDRVPGVDLQSETEAFRDCEFGKAHSDWDATWRTWMRRAAKDRKPAGHNGHNGNHAEPDWVRERRERTQQAAPYAAVRTTGNDSKTIDVETKNARARIPG